MCCEKNVIVSQKTCKLVQVPWSRGQLIFWSTLYINENAFYLPFVAYWYAYSVWYLPVRLIFARLWQNTNVMLSMLSEGTHFTHATLCCCDTSYDSVLVLVHVCNVSAFYQNWWMDQAGFHVETLLNQSYTDFLSKFKYQAFIKKIRVHLSGTLSFCLKISPRQVDCHSMLLT